MLRPRRALAALGLLTALVAACAGPGTARRPAGTQVVQVPLRWSHAYLLLGERPVLVDPGSPGEGDAARLADALAAYGLAWADLSLVVVTHGHADHAGGAAHAVAASGAPLLAGAADGARLRSGDGGPLAPMGLEAELVRPFVPKTFTPVAPTLTLAAAPGAAALDLRPYGVRGTARLAPGHTDGSLVVVLDGADGAPREAIVGDLFRGGVFGGRVGAQTPHRHYYHDDPERAEAAVRMLLRDGVERFYLGHGGPVTAAAARARFGGPAPR